MTRAELMEQLDDAIWEATGDLAGPDDDTRYVTINGDHYEFKVSGKGHDRYKVTRIKTYTVLIPAPKLVREKEVEHCDFRRVEILLNFESDAQRSY